MAVHSGTAEKRGDDYFGPALNRVARLLALGHGGQVLATGAVAELVSAEREAEPAKLLGEHPLDGNIDPIDVIDSVSSLVGKSLVVADAGESATRYRLLETARLYELEKSVDGPGRRAQGRRDTPAGGRPGLSVAGRAPFTRLSSPAKPAAGGLRSRGIQDNPSAPTPVLGCFSNG